MEEIKIEHETATLQDTAKTGKVKYWKKQVLTDGTNYYTRSVFWQENGAVTFAEPTLIQAKNVGRANEVSPKDQAYKEATAEFKKKLDKGYSAPGYTSNTASYLKPMLAHAYKDHMQKLPDTVYWETKYDGVRCLLGKTNDQLSSWSRLGKPFGEFITSLFDGLNGLNVILDGELMLPVENYTFEQTVSAIKKDRALTTELEYWVYDMYDPCDPNKEMYLRHAALINMRLSDINSHIKLVQRHLVSKENLEEYYHIARAEGHEGIIIRNPWGIYEPDTRSYNLMKFKGWQCESDEFVIIGVKDGVGREAGKAIFSCTAGDKTFDVRLKGSMSYRAELWEKRQELIGKRLTVEYQNLTADNIPRFPVGIAIRDYE